MDRVGEQRHGATRSNHDRLQHGRHEQDDQTDLQRANARRARLERIVHGISRVVGVRDEQAVEEAFQARGMAVAVSTVLVVVVFVLTRTVVVRVLVVVRTVVVLVVRVAVLVGRVAVGGGH